MKHSPAPWRFDHDTGGCRTIRCNRPEADRDSGDNEVCCTPGLADDDEDYANALVLSAAPDMLDALKASVHELEYLERQGLQVLALQRVKNAIAKAEL
jgi:hypothetical protein